MQIQAGELYTIFFLSLCLDCEFASLDDKSFAKAHVGMGCNLCSAAISFTRVTAACNYRAAELLCLNGDGLCRFSPKLSEA